MRFQVTIDGRAARVDLDDLPDGHTRVTIEDQGQHQEHVVDARDLGAGAWSLLNRAPGAAPTLRSVQVDGPLNKLNLVVAHADGEPRSVIAEVSVPQTSAAAGLGNADASGPVTLRAPIPGKIVKILVAAGEHVKAGQPVIILEAMKMENEIRAPRDGDVKVVHASEGASVETGQDLVSLI